MEFPDADFLGSNFRSELNRRLMDARMLVVNEPLTSSVAARVSEQLTVMDAESDEPVLIMMSGGPGGKVEAGLSTYDLLRSVEAPITMLATGRVVGGGVVAFVAPPIERRFALPHARFRFEGPAGRLDGDRGQDLETEAEEIAELRRRTVDVLVEGTGLSEEQVTEAMSTRHTVDAEAAVERGLIHRVVEHRKEID